MVRRDGLEFVRHGAGPLQHDDVPLAAHVLREPHQVGMHLREVAVTKQRHAGFTPW